VLQITAKVSINAMPLNVCVTNDSVPDEGTQLYAEINPIDEEVYPQQHQQLKMPKTHIPRESDAFLMEVSKSNTSIVGSGCSDREKSAEAHNQVGGIFIILPHISVLN
jgi:hypothetical protein